MQLRYPNINRRWRTWYKKSNLQHCSHTKRYLWHLIGDMRIRFPRGQA